MKYLISLAVVCLITVPHVAGQQKPKTLVTGLKDPGGVAVGPGGKIYVTVTENSSRDGTGAVVRIDNGKVVPFATGLDAAMGIVAFQNWLFVADNQRVWRIDAKGKAEVFAAASAFPGPLHQLIGIAVDPESGTLYVSDYGDVDKKKDGTIYRITPKGKVSVVAEAKSLPQINHPPQ